MSPRTRHRAATALAGATVGATVLVTTAGCASGRSAAEHAAGAQDALFGDYMSQHDLTRYGDPAALRDLAHDLCTAEEQGTDPAQALGTVTAAGLPAADAEQFATAATTVYCPQYAGGFSLLDPLDTGS